MIIWKPRCWCRRPQWKLTFRNLGWSGDTVGGVSRAVFGSPQDGFTRLDRDLRLAKPTVVVLHYGNNEAHQGAEGLDAFRQQADRLMQLISELSARLIVVSPRRYEEASAFRVYPDAYNRDLVFYRAALKELTLQHGGAWLPWDEYVAGPLTRDGVQFSDFGYRIAAQWLADQLNGDENVWRRDDHEPRRGTSGDWRQHQ